MHVRADTAPSSKHFLCPAANYLEVQTYRQTPRSHANMSPKPTQC